MGFNGISDFQWRKGRVSAAVTLIAGHGTRFTVAQLEARELAAQERNTREGIRKFRASSEQPALGSSFIANTDFSFSRAQGQRLAARLLAAREMLSARSFPSPAVRNRGWGFSARHRHSEQPQW